MDKDWELLFSPRVLERGYDYWCDGLVCMVSKSSSIVKAVVSGSEDYEVEISLDSRGGIAKMLCDCPHAFDGNNCKHMAAVIYELEEGCDEKDYGEDDSEDVSGKTHPSLQEIIELLTPEQLRAELLRTVSTDAVQTAQLIARYAPKGSEEARTAAGATGAKATETSSDEWDEYIKAMRNRIRLIIQNCSDRGFVDWRQGRHLVQALNGEVFNDLSDILEYGEEANVAFELSLYLLNELSNIDIDGSDGEHDELGGSLDSLWEGIYELADDGQRRAMFESMLAYYEGTSDGQWYFADLVWSFMQNHFDTRVLNERKLALVDNKLKGLNEQIEAAAKMAADRAQRKMPRDVLSRFSSGSDYELASLVCERMRLMEKLGYDKAEIVLFRNRFRFLHQIRELEMKELEDEGRYEELVALLTESRELDSGYAGLVAKYSNLLIECHKKLGQHDRVRQEAYDYVVRYQLGSLEGFTRLKALYPAQEWKKVRERVFDALLARKINLNALYREECLYDRIMAAIEKETTDHPAYRFSVLQEIARYEGVLKPAYEEKLLDIYRRSVVAMARPASGRAGYQEIVKVLRRMLNYDGGEPCVRSLLNEWRSTYSNRPAMQDELRQVFVRY
jgi:hypothetical protein